MPTKLHKLIALFFIVLLVNTAYLWAFADPTIFYMTNVMFHICSGTVLLGALIWVALKDADLREGTSKAIGLFLLSLALGVFLCMGAYIKGAGNITQNRWAFWAHIGCALIGVGLLMPYMWRKAREQGGGWLQFKKAFQVSAALLLLWPAAAELYRKTLPDAQARIRNPLVVPTRMEEEGAGPKSPFFPSSANTNVNGIIPSNFFMDSEACGECHKDIYEQWKSSAHHFASFNNQFYRKSIEYMQDVVGTQPSKWCAGCHDHAVFFNGRFDRPMKEQVDTPEAHAGLACTSCHSIVHIGSSMGQGNFLIEYPPLHELATSKNKYIRAFDRFLTFVEPRPHKGTFMKPFMRQDTAEYCSTCHKVHLDIPVNKYRWVRGFNDYDNWQASGVSGQGARSFYYPKENQHCGNCHMPLVPSKDPGNVNGQVHSHRFPGANTALPFVNRDHAQAGATERFLKSGFITVDIFSVSPVEDTKDTQMVRRSGDVPQLSTSFGVGEEAEQTGQGFIREVGKLAAPVNTSNAKIEPGSTVRVDVVVRTRKIGHFFPGGTVDAFDIWLELIAKDADGKNIFWSGRVEDNGAGPVEPGAHFYKAYQLDGEGNPINKRNAWQMRSVLYVRLIPPGAADVGHFRLKIPKDVKGPITLTAKLNHRKFSHYYTQFSYAGQPKDGQHHNAALLSDSHNSMEYSFDLANVPKNVSGQIKGEIPVLPITTLAQAEAKLEMGTPKWEPVVTKADRERWNDWGIGLLLQGDLKGAEYAFKKVTEAEPGYADGWLNVARALIQEGETDAAKPFIRKAIDIDASLGRIYFFRSQIERADGDYDAALVSLNKTLEKYPRDRVVLNNAARILFLKRDYKQALEMLQRVCLVDPEDLQMHYTAMLCYRGLGDKENAAREERLFRRFKAEESSMAITGKRRLISPEDNNERQQIHDHESVPLDRPAIRPPLTTPIPTKMVEKPGKSGKVEPVAGGGQ